MKLRDQMVFCFALCFLLIASKPSRSEPTWPTDPEHPGSAVYPFEVESRVLQLMGRRVNAFLPQNVDRPVPVVIFGHGQALDVQHYERTFVHLAGRGIGVLFPMYDTGFFDQNWRRMASDYNQLTRLAIEELSGQLDRNLVIYSGHSKGAYVALMAAGAPDRESVGSVVLFSPAGHDREYLARLPEDLPLSIIHGDNDRIINRSDLLTIYDRAPSLFKQLIDVASYPNLSADHFFILTRSSFAGGRTGVSGFHFEGVWKWIIGAVWDLEQGSLKLNTFLFGKEALTSGLEGLQHQAIRSWGE